MNRLNLPEQLIWSLACFLLSLLTVWKVSARLAAPFPYWGEDGNFSIMGRQCKWSPIAWQM